MYPPDPVNLTPIPHLIDSYVYHSEPYLPEASSSTAASESTSAVLKEEDGWIMGIDEAGRGRMSAVASIVMTVCGRGLHGSGDRADGVRCCLLPEILRADIRSHGL